MGKQISENDWATSGIKEAPYWQEGMSPEEYDREREYYLKNYEDIRSGRVKYIPLKGKMQGGDNRMTLTKGFSLDEIFINSIIKVEE